MRGNPERRPAVGSTRRAVLKGSLVGAGIATFSTGLASPSSGSAGDPLPTQYDTVTVPSNNDPKRNPTVRLGSGDVLENVLIDQTAPGAQGRIVATGDDWVIRNVGFRGVGRWDDGEQGESFFHLYVSGNGRIENLHIDDREPPGTRGTTNAGGALVARGHGGRIDVRNTFVAGCGNNAFYGGNPGSGGGGDGVVTFENCYHRDNTVSQFRIGTPGSYVENCVVVVDDPEGRRGQYPNGSKNARGVLARHHEDLTADSCTIHVSPDDVDTDPAFVSWHRSGQSNGATCRLEVVDCDVSPDTQRIERNSGGDVVFAGGSGPGRDPTVAVVDEGVPLSPEMAARGDRARPDDPT